MQAVDYHDHDTTPEKTSSTTSMAASYSLHLASLLKANPYPAQS